MWRDASHELIHILLITVDYCFKTGCAKLRKLLNEHLNNPPGTNRTVIRVKYFHYRFPSRAHCNFIMNDHEKRHRCTPVKREKEKIHSYHYQLWLRPFPLVAEKKIKTQQPGLIIIKKTATQQNHLNLYLYRFWLLWGERKKETLSWVSNNAGS